MKPTSPPWQWSLLVRLIIEITRTLSLLAVFALTVLFLAGGLAQLYVDGNSFTSSDLSNLVPGIQDIKVAWDKYHEALLAEHIANTLWATLTGLALGIGVGLLLAALMDLTPILRWLLYPILILSQTIPIFAIAVVLILIFGFGFGPKIVVVMLFSFYPITVSTLAGLQSVDPVHTSLLRSMGANSLQIWWKVHLPTAMPSFFSGLRIAATYSVVGAVIGEYVGAGNGLGKFLQRSYQSFKTDQVFLAVIIIATLSIMLVVLVTLIEFVTLRWRYAGRQPAQGFIIRLLWAGLAVVWRLRHRPSPAKKSLSAKKEAIPS